ncbi:MAG: MBL fold metallo-hydrolase [Fimbriimonadaceae bacterium]
MVLRRFYDEKLAQASFLVGCGATGEAIVIDPLRDADMYVRAAAAEGLRITAVTETHIHADFLSGIRELSARTGARMYLSGEGGPDWLYEFADDPLVTVVHDGDAVRVGNVRLDVLHTPGHTPEHITFVLTDEPASAASLGAFTGDFIFVGDVGRPDLLEKAANVMGTMEASARRLYGSLQSFKASSDGLLVWPGHGAGSACGKNLGGAPVSSVGYERAANWAFKAKSEQEFVDEVLSGQPEPPKYFAMMKTLNKRGQRILGGLHLPQRVSGEEMVRLAEEEAQIIDLRPVGESAKGYVPGTIIIPQDRSFVNWAGWLMRYDAPIYLIAEDEGQVMTAVRDLALIGLDAVTGWSGPEALAAYAAKHGALPRIEDLPVDRLSEAAVLDVRGSSERAEGHVPGSLHIPLGYLPDRLECLPKDRSIAVHCASGSRSLIAVSLLKRLGIENACNVPGGFDEYMNRGYPVDRVGGGPEPTAR